MRYYAEWLDGEYDLLNQAIRGYDHSAVAERAIRFHALLGSTIVLSDIQMLDNKTPIPRLFRDPDFRFFLNKKQENKQNFLALVADPVRGIKDQKFAIAMKGIERLRDQAKKPPESYEMAVTRLSEPLLRGDSFDADRYLDSRHFGEGHIGRAIKHYHQYRRELQGLLHAVDYFSRSPLRDTTKPTAGSPGRYDKLLANAQTGMSDAHAERVEKILSVQKKQLPESQWGRRAAIRKVLAPGEWHKETSWTGETLRLYLDVIHAWNCAININIAPEAGTLYESSDDLPLSTYQRAVTDKVGWFRPDWMSIAGLPPAIRRLFCWDPLDTDWKHIAFLAFETQETAERLQTCLKTGTREDVGYALEEHARKIAECVVNV
jgi:hypothetical protein